MLLHSFRLATLNLKVKWQETLVDIVGHRRFKIISCATNRSPILISYLCSSDFFVWFKPFARLFTNSIWTERRFGRWMSVRLSVTSPICNRLTTNFFLYLLTFFIFVTHTIVKLRRLSFDLHWRTYNNARWAARSNGTEVIDRFPTPVLYRLAVWIFRPSLTIEILWNLFTGQ